MNPDLLPPISSKPTVNATSVKTETATTKKPDNPNTPATKTNLPEPKLTSLNKLPKSILLLIGLVSLTLLLLITVQFIPKKDSSPNQDTISTESIPEPQITIPNDQETKQTPFTQEIIDFKKNSADLDFDYSMYNLPVVDTEFNLTK